MMVDKINVPPAAMIRTCQQVRCVCLAGLMLSLPLSIAGVSLCLALLWLTFVIEAIVSKQFPRPALPINRPILAYLLAVLLTTPFSVNFARSVTALPTLLDIAVVYLVYLSCQSSDDYVHALNYLLGALAAASAYGILQHYLEIDIFRLPEPMSFLKYVNDDFHAPVRISGFSSYMTFAGQLAMGLPLICGSFLSARTSLQKCCWLAALTLSSLALLWTYTRSAWVAVTCALLICGYLRQGRKFVLGALLCLVLLGGLIIFQARAPEHPAQPAETVSQPSAHAPERASSTNILDRIASIFNTEENKERLYTWESTLYMILDHPLTGIGKENFTALAPSYRSAYNMVFTSTAHAHNNFLQIAVDSGLPGLLSFLWLVSVLFWSAIRLYHDIPAEQRTAKLQALSFLGAFIVFFVHGLFECNFGDSEVSLMMWVVVAGMLALKTRPART